MTLPPETARSTPGRFRFADFTLDFDGRALLDASGQDVPLRRMEFDLLATLVRCPGRVLSRDYLLEAVAGRGAERFDRSIDVMVSRLRKRVEPDPASPRLILTVAGVGYKFAAKVQPVAEASEPAPEPVQPLAERRQLTLLRGTLADAAALSARLDPEDLHRVVAAFQDCCTPVIAGFGGVVARSQADGVLAYFGYPQAHEDDAERAIRAGLAVVAATAKLQPDLSVPAAAKVGIATGNVVIGDLLGEHEHAVLGEAPSLAARLASDTAAGSVVVSAATARLVGGLFAYRALVDIGAFQVLGEGEAKGRFEAMHGGSLSPFVGRAEELALLLRRWQRAKAGAGRVVHVSGEAGIGKSRLVHEFRNRVAGEPHATLAFFCSPVRQDSAYYPIIRQLEEAAGFDRGDSPAQRLAKLEAMLRATGTPPEGIALIAGLVSVPAGDRYPKPDLSPRLRRARTLATLLAHIEAIAQRGPVLIIVEDTHWIDPSSREVLDTLIERIATRPVLVIATARPAPAGTQGQEVSPAWPGGAPAETLLLNRLDDAEIGEMIGEIGEALPQSARGQIVARADGVPLFAEELTRTVLEGGMLSLPASLHDLIMARLDRVPAAKQVAQIGAVIGREFSHVLLATIAGLPDVRLTQGLGELVGAGLAFRRGVPPDAVYAFKHALVQDAAHDSLLRARRAEIHAAIVGALESGADTAAVQPALLGYHCAQAGLIAKAATYYCRAGERSEEQAAAAETQALLDRGLTLVGTLPDGPARWRLEAELLLALGLMLCMTKTWTDPGCATAFDRAVYLSRRLDDTEPIARALRVRSFDFLARGNHAAAWQDARELLSVAERAGDARIESVARIGLGFLHHFSGHFSEARANWQTARELSASESGLPAGSGDIELWVVGPLFPSALALACLGDLDRAATEIAECTSELRQCSSFGRALGFSHLCHFDIIVTRDMTALREHAASCGALAEEQAFTLCAMMARFYNAWLDVQAGHTEAGLRELRAGLAWRRSVNWKLGASVLCFIIADALAFAGQTTDAIEALDDGLAYSARTGEAWLDAELYCTKGELLLAVAEPDPVQAEQQFRRAIDVARGQSAKLFELRAATSYARLLRDQGRRAEAQALLAAIYGRFTEGFDTVPLRSAKALLNDFERAPPARVAASPF